MPNSKITETSFIPNKEIDFELKLNPPKPTSKAPLPPEILKKAQQSIPSTISPTSLKKEEHAPSAHKETEDKFGSAEHIAIGDKAFREFCDEIIENDNKSILSALLTSDKKWLIRIPHADPNQVKFSIKVTEDFNLSPGEIVALAGDFYAVIDAPISFGRDDNNHEEKKQRFINAYQTLIKAKPEEVKELLHQISLETDVVKKALKEGKKPNVELEAIADEQNEAYAAITRKHEPKKYPFLSKFTFFPITFLRSPYIKLAAMNYDHFGSEARIAYRIGHDLAIKTAQEASKLEKSEEKLAGLLKAFIQELYACHFLTDTFASGHIRTPRKALLEHVMSESKVPLKNGKSAIAGLLAKEMHDEDGRLGVWVKNEHTASWRMFGDSCYFEYENKQNADEVNKVVKAALNDVYQAFCGKQFEKEADYEYLAYLPDVDEEKQKTVSYPLFRVNKENGKVERRADIDDPKKDGYIQEWKPTETLLRLKTKKIRHENAEELNAFAKKLENELEELDKMVEGIVQCRIS